MKIIVWFEDEGGHMSKECADGEVGARPMVGDTIHFEGTSTLCIVLRIEIPVYLPDTNHVGWPDVVVYCKRR